MSEVKTKGARSLGQGEHTGRSTGWRKPALGPSQGRAPPTSHHLCGPGCPGPLFSSSVPALTLTGPRDFLHWLLACRGWGFLSRLRHRVPSAPQGANRWPCRLPQGPAVLDLFLSLLSPKLLPGTTLPRGLVSVLPSPAGQHPPHTPASRLPETAADHPRPPTTTHDHRRPLTA